MHAENLKSARERRVII